MQDIIHYSGAVRRPVDFRSRRVRRPQDIEPMTSDPIVAVEALMPSLLAEPRLAPLLAEAGPWWLWSADGSRLIATNAAGARAMGATGAALAASRTYSPSHVFAGQIGRLGAGLAAGDAPRTDRLRIYGRFGSESAVAVIERLEVEGIALVSAVLPGQSQGASREALSAFFAGWPQAALVFDTHGAPMATSDAARMLAGHSLSALIGAKADAALEDMARDGRARLPLVTGELHLVAVPAAEAIVGLLPAAEAETAREGLRLVNPAPTVADEQAEAGETASEEALAEEPSAETAPVAAPVLPAAENVPAASPHDADDLDIPQRFSWRLDASQRFHSIDPQTVGAPEGLTLAEADARFGLDPQGTLTAAVAASRPFSGVPAIWPLAETPRRLAVTLAAFPSHRDGAFHGYAGFGLIVEEVAPAQDRAAEVPVAAEASGEPAEADDIAAETNGAADGEAVAAEKTAADEPARADEPMAESTVSAPDLTSPAEPASTAETASPTEPTSTTEPAPTTDVAAGDEPSDAGSAAVAEPAASEPLPDRRPSLTVLTKSDNVVALRTSVGQDPKRLILSPGERNAFREIARALGARTESETPPPADMPLAADKPAVTDAAETAGTPELIAQPVQATSDDSVAPEAASASEPESEASAASEPTPAEPASAAAETSITPPLTPPPLDAEAPLVPRPAAFIESGTPFGPWPSAFGATPPIDAETPSADADDTPARWPAPEPVVPQAAEKGPVEPAVDSGLKALLDRLPLGLLVHRGNAVLFANRTLLDWTGFADAQAVEQAGGLARLFAGEPTAENGETALSLTTATGAALPVEAHLSRTAWAGEPAFLFTLRRPEAEAHEPDAELSELRGRLDEVEQILDTATDGIVIVNADATIESMNRSAEALFGYESAEVKGRSVTALFAPESHRSALDYCDGLLSNGVASVLNDGRQIIGRVKQGGLIPLYMTMGRTGPAGRPKLAAVFRDMTQWKKAEEDLIAARRQAEQASSQKSDFLAKISHEIRTPLNAIIGFSEVMMEERFGPVGNERYRDYLRDIHSSGGHVLSLINDLLDLSKIEAGKLEMSFTSVDLNDVVQSTVAIMQPQANRERVIIRSSLQARLPNVVADARSLRQIVLNLLSNSVKFTPAGGQIIVSTALSEAGEAVLRVRDTGVGMSEMELKAAMEPFRQVATSNPHASKGTGLGLPLTKALVEANRASFGISSTPNQGTLVEVVFPPTRVLAE